MNLAGPRLLAKGAAMGANRSIWTMVFLATISSSAAAQDAMPWAADLESAKQLAAQKNQLVMIHFWAPNCPPCRMLDATLFRDPQFAAAVAKDYVPVKVNAAEERAIASQYGVDRWPQDVIILPSGQMVYRMVSKQEKEKTQYLAVLHGVAVKSAGMSQFAATGTPEAKPVSYPGEAAAPTGGYSRFGAGATAAAQPPAQSDTQSRFSTQPPAAAQESSVANQSTTPSQSRFSAGYAAMPPADQAAPKRPEEAQSPSGYAAGPSQGSAPQRPASGSRFSAQPSTAPYGGPASQQSESPSQDRFASQREPAPRTTLPTAAPSQPTPPQANEQPKFALDGFCPVTLAEGMKWQKGDARWGAVHEGRVYLFASDAEQRKFLATPERFSPVLSGNDPVAYLEQGRLIEGDRSHGLTYNGVLYLFSSEESLKTFWGAPQRYAAQVRQAMLRNSQQLR
ncbi:MAG: thioredoxin domain-containing protein [Blastopirellula sp. JB062]